jgi:EAL domain-containing protein (putative c-di-GMP-specific phosphodiesterase class I)
MPDVSDEVLALMRRVGVNPHDVWLEVTEKRHAGDDVTDSTQKLRRIGVHFALDDFGSYYSNLAYLKQFPAECLKIDRSFIGGVAIEGTDRSIVLAILAMAKSLDMEVVAEGVESAAQRDALITLGCRLGQGYLFAPALSAKEATRLLTEVAAGVGLAVDVAGDGLPGARVGVRGG